MLLTSVVGAVSFSAAGLLAGYLIFSHANAPVHNAHTVNIEEASLRAQADAKNILREMGELDAELQRLRMLGQHIAQETGVKVEAFALQDPVPRGGFERQAQIGAEIDLSAQLARLKSQATQMAQGIDVLSGVAAQKLVSVETAPNRWPVPDGWVSSGYGYRASPFGGARRLHKGLDIAAPYGSDVRAIAGGRVSSVSYHHAYGRLLEIDHGNGYVSRYAHNAKILVQSGDTVRKGQTVAQVGTSGRSTGPHLHLEILREGRTINPEPLLSAVILK